MQLYFFIQLNFSTLEILQLNWPPLLVWKGVRYSNYFCRCVVYVCVCARARLCLSVCLTLSLPPSLPPSPFLPPSLPLCACVCANLSRQCVLCVYVLQHVVVPFPYNMCLCKSCNTLSIIFQTPRGPVSRQELRQKSPRTDLKSDSNPTNCPSRTTEVNLLMTPRSPRRYLSLTFFVILLWHQTTE